MNTQIFKEFPKQNILVMGDLILDHYVFGKVSRISPEAPIPIFDFEREEYRLGGASNVAGNLVSLGVKTSLMGCVGNDDCADIILQELVRHNIQTDSIFKDKERPTTIKTRYIAQGQHLLRADKEEKKDSQQLEKFYTYLTNNIQQYNSLIISDYAKGFLVPKLCEFAIQLAQQNNIKVFVGPKGTNWDKYKHAFLLSANRSETEIIAGEKLSTKDNIIQAGNDIIQKLDLQAMLITLGAAGMMLCIRKKESIYLPTQAREVYDVVGAGDTVLAMVGLCQTTQNSWKLSLNIANKAAGIVVGKVGASLVTLEELQRA